MSNRSPFINMSKQEIVVQLLNVFRQYGYDGTSLSQISQVIGLSKASLYHHFPSGKEEMATAALDYLDSWLEADILKLLRNSETTPFERLKAMLEKVELVFDQGRKPCLWAVLTLEGRSDRFHTQIKQTLSRWIEAIAEVLQEVGMDAEQAKYQSEDAIVRIQGALVLARGLDNPDLFNRTIKELAAQFLQISCA